MSQPAAIEGAGQRRPNDGDLDAILEMIWDGKSLRQTCEKLGLHVPSTSDWLHADDGRREQYACARVGRADYQQDQMNDVAVAAALGGEVTINGVTAKVDAAGARVLLDTLKWTAARMDPKTVPVQRIDLLSRTRQMTDAEIAAEIAAHEGAGSAED